MIDIKKLNDGGLALREVENTGIYYEIGGMPRNYVFGLYDGGDRLIDTTNVDENDPELAMELFTQFAANENYSIDDTTGHYVMLLDEEAE